MCARVYKCARIQWFRGVQAARARHVDSGWYTRKQMHTPAHTHTHTENFSHLKHISQII